jgi:glutamate racemase
MSLVRIGVFDSGVGGLSVLRELRSRLPHAALHYVADSGHAPYGERSQHHVMIRSLRLASYLIEEGAQLVVIACNTATAVAAERLRDTWPQTPVVGVEPGIKPALLITRNGRIGVMATRATLHSEKFHRLVAKCKTGTSLHLRACDGLAAAIEGGLAGNSQMLALVEQHCAPLREAGVDTVVLGCTHYTFAQRQIQAAFGPGTRIIDTAAAVARHVETTALEIRGTKDRRMDDEQWLRLETTGDAAALRHFASHWLEHVSTARHISV